jgi:RNA polymerase sigma factor (sigma-70 family)
MVPPPDQARWFAEEVHPHEPELRAFLRRHFPTVQDIDDLVQEAYMRLLRARHAGSIAEPRAYLFTTARNIACDLFRRQRPVSIEDLAETQRMAVVEDKADAAETASHSQEIELLIAAVQALPPRCREVVTLRKLHGLSYRDIAVRLGISENTVNAQLAIGLVRCRQYLAARGVVKQNGQAHEST